MRKKIIVGPLIHEFYENGKLVERKVNKYALLNADHWRGWQDFDKNFGKTYLKSAFDSRHGENVMIYYSNENKDLNRKHIYRRYFKFRPRLKKMK